MLRTIEGQKDDVMSMLSNAFQDKIARNRSILHSILKTIYLPVCGKQNSTSSFCMVGDRYLAFGGLFCK
jgi:drug/metabolite transporter superfamily protein YnfA